MSEGAGAPVGEHQACAQPSVRAPVEQGTELVPGHRRRFATGSPAPAP